MKLGLLKWGLIIFNVAFWVSEPIKLNFNNVVIKIMVATVEHESVLSIERQFIEECVHAVLVYFFRDQ